jgi:hypothetical protein
VALAVAAAASACASSSFERAINAQQWSNASTLFQQDSALQRDERALFQAAMLYSFPGRETYDPERARTLFRRLLELYPSTRYRQGAVNHLALLYELQRVQGDADSRERELRSVIALLASDTTILRQRLDSIAVRLQAEQDQSALLRKVSTRLESDLRDRESQLRELTAELKQLKAIDLKSPSRGKLSDTTDRARKVPVKPR